MSIRQTHTVAIREAAVAIATMVTAALAPAALAATPVLPGVALTAEQQAKHADALSIAAKSPAVAKALATGKAAPAAPGATAQAKALATAAATPGCATQPGAVDAKEKPGTYVQAKFSSAVPLSQRLAQSKNTPPSAKGEPNWAFVSVAGKSAIGKGKGPPQLVWPVATGPGAPKLGLPPVQ